MTRKAVMTVMAPVMIVHLPPFLCSSPLLFSRWEDDWWCFSENHWSLTSLQHSALLLQRAESLLLATRLLDRLHTTHNGLCTVEVSSVSLPPAPSLLLADFRRWVTSFRGFLWQSRGVNLILVSVQEATYYSAYECVEFISTHSSVCANSFSSAVSPLKILSLCNELIENSWLAHRHSQRHISSLAELWWDCPLNVYLLHHKVQIECVLRHRRP